MSEAWKIRPPFVAAFYGTSLTTGRLSTFWAERLQETLRTVPEAIGPVIVHNLGKGSQTSDWGAANAYTVAQIRPTAVWSEDFTINDCFEAGGVPQVTQVQQAANMQTMHDAWVAPNPDVVITWQSMSSVDATVAAGRPTLAARYAAGLVKGAAMGDRTLDHYLGAPHGPGGGWVKPLPTNLSNPQTPFSIPPTPSFIGFPNAVTWNPADKSASVSLFNGNLMATSNGPVTYGGVRGTVPVTGRKHFQMFAEFAQYGFPGVGVANLAANLGAGLGEDANSIGLFTNGFVRFGGATLGNVGFTYATGETIAVEVDEPNRLIYFMKGAIRSVGFDISTLAGDIYPVLQVYDQSNTGWGTFNDNGDGLHPLRYGGTDTYLEPALIWDIRTVMADFYGLPAPT